MFDNQEIDYIQSTEGALGDAPKESRVPNVPVNKDFEPYWQRSNIAPYSPRYRKPANIDVPSSDPLGAPYVPPEQKSSFQVGALVSSFIIIGATVGYSLEGKLSSRFKAAGYGSLIGAVLANAIRYTVATTSASGFKAGAMGLVGASVPLLPIGLIMLTKRPLKKSNVYLIGGWSALVSGYIVVNHLRKKLGF
tara:strand:+ start:4180 stop:4758 length:579 start_codon:yes stop_codon:yes gene_type:complete